MQVLSPRKVARIGFFVALVLHVWVFLIFSMVYTRCRFLKADDFLFTHERTFVRLSASTLDENSDHLHTYYKIFQPITTQLCNINSKLFYDWDLVYRI